MSRSMEARLRKVEGALQPLGPLAVVWTDSADPAEEAFRVAEAKAAGRVKANSRIVFVRWREVVEGAPDGQQIH